MVTWENILLTIAIAIFLGLLSFIPYNIGYNAGYRDGQIDAPTGTIYYKLEQQSNSEFRWVECQGVCWYGKEDK